MAKKTQGGQGGGARIDPELKLLKALGRKAAETHRKRTRITPIRGGEPARIPVLVRVDGDPAKLSCRGFELRSAHGPIATGLIELDHVDDLAALPGVVSIEVASRNDPSLDASVPEVRADLVLNGTPSYRGNGVIVGIVDTGVDFEHENFIGAGGNTRIRRIWDMRLTPQGTESNPAGFAYGVEYTNADIDNALAAANPKTVVRHLDDRVDGHGTHVCGIAAGDGSAPGDTGEAAFTFVGVAPEADIVVVALDTFGNDEILDAIDYVFGVATDLNRPTVVNLSLGNNIGPHDGTSNYETAIDAALGDEGRCLVVASGNEANDDRHGTGTVTLNNTDAVQIQVAPNRTGAEAIDIWYDGADRFAVSVTPPGGAATANVAAGNSSLFNLANNNQVWVDSDLNDPNNADNCIRVEILQNTAATIQQGAWTITLRGDTVNNGDYDLWIWQDGNAGASITSAHATVAGSAMVPSTATEVISVGSYITTGAGLGSLSDFSGRGPTRDGRQVPTLCAPGQTITSCRSSDMGVAGNYRATSGTSMATPHVSGTIALMLDKKRSQTQARVQTCLENTVRSDGDTGAVPNDDWGAGKLDVKGAVDCVSIIKLLTADIGKILQDGVVTRATRDVVKTVASDTVTDPRRDFVKHAALDTQPDQDLIDGGFEDPGWDTKPSIDAVKTHGYDKGSDDQDIYREPARRQPFRRAPRRPFVLSTPHHAPVDEGGRRGSRTSIDALVDQAARQIADSLAAQQRGELTDDAAQLLEEQVRQYRELMAALGQR